MKDEETKVMVAVLAVSSEGKVLYGASKPELPFEGPKPWSLPIGEIGYNEGLVTAAKRILKEQTGILSKETSFYHLNTAKVFQDGKPCLVVAYKVFIGMSKAESEDILWELYDFYYPPVCLDGRSQEAANTFVKQVIRKE